MLNKFAFVDNGYISIYFLCLSFLDVKSNPSCFASIFGVLDSASELVFFLSFKIEFLHQAAFL